MVLECQLPRVLVISHGLDPAGPTCGAMNSIMNVVFMTVRWKAKHDCPRGSEITRMFTNIMHLLHSCSRNDENLAIPATAALVHRKPKVEARVENRKCDAIFQTHSLASSLMSPPRRRTV